MSNTIYCIKASDYNNVINFFCTEEENTISTIASRFSLEEPYVNYLIDFYLSLKNNYMGGNINISTGQPTRYKSIKLIVKNSDGNIAGAYRSIKECAIDLRVSDSWLYKKLSGVKSCTITHENKETYTYEKREEGDEIV